MDIFILTTFPSGPTTVVPAPRPCPAPPAALEPARLPAPPWCCWMLEHELRLSLHIMELFSDTESSATAAEFDDDPPEQGEKAYFELVVHE